MNAKKTNAVAMVEGLESRELFAAAPVDIAWSMTGPASATPGQRIQVTVTHRNAGSTTAGSYSQSCKNAVLSTDRSISVNDRSLGLVPRMNLILSPGESYSYKTWVTISRNATAGSYYILAKFSDDLPARAGQRLDSNPNNNTAIMPIRINRAQSAMQLAPQQQHVGQQPSTDPIIATYKAILA